MANVAAILHDGRAPSGGRKTCLAALEELGERERCETAQEALNELRNLTERGWAAVRTVREAVVIRGLEPTRRADAKYRLAELAEQVGRADDVGAKVASALDGLVDRVWIDRHLAERIGPLRAELDCFRRTM